MQIKLLFFYHSWILFVTNLTLPVSVIDSTVDKRNHYKL